MEEFLSYEECLQLRDAGFPQPVNVATGQAWYSPQIPEYPQLLSILKNVSDAEKGHVVCVTMLEMLTDPRQFYHEIDIIGKWVYCPTVEDMLSLLKPGYGLERVPGAGWSVVYFRTNKLRDVLQMGDDAMDVLNKAWISRRHIFEDTP